MENTYYENYDAEKVREMLAKRMNDLANSSEKLYLPTWTPAIKATDRNMRCKKTQFSMNKVESIPPEEDIIKGITGFHVCGNIFSINKYYKFVNMHYNKNGISLTWNQNNYRLFNVSIKGYVDYGHDADNIAAEHIRFDSEIDMTNGIFKYNNNFIKVYNNKIHSEDGYAMCIDNVNYKVHHGELIYAEFNENDVQIVYKKETIEKIYEDNCGKKYDNYYNFIKMAFIRELPSFIAVSILNNIQVETIDEYNNKIKSHQSQFIPAQQNINQNFANQLITGRPVVTAGLLPWSPNIINYTNNVIPTGNILRFITQPNIYKSLH